MTELDWAARKALLREAAQLLEHATYVLSARRRDRVSRGLQPDFGDER
ncbi:MAG TPA: hypothetical protein VK046_08255 [Actinomycetaceae bacterium]|nr:hypothetical protein [Actinomycetaceae bacterium]